MTGLVGPGIALSLVSFLVKPFVTSLKKEANN
jgi:hypothetical protein